MADRLPNVKLNVTAHLTAEGIDNPAFGSLHVSSTLDLGTVTFDELGGIFARLHTFAEDIERALKGHG